MKTFSFALASIRYHKSVLMFYFIMATITTCGMIFCHAQLDSLKELTYNSEQMFSLIGDSVNLLKKELATIETTYVSFLFFILSVFILFFSGYFFYYQKKKQAEFEIWKIKGGSLRQWLMMQFIEISIPLLLAGIFTLILLLLFQPLWQTFLTNQQLIILDQQNLLSPFWQALESNTSEHLIVTIPQTNQAISHVLALDNSDWLQIFFTGFIRVFTQLAAISSILILLISGGFCIHWRNDSCQLQKK